MDETERDERLNEIVRRFFESAPATLLGSFGPPFDISKPNMHDNKPDFIAERDAVEEAMKNVGGLMSLLASRYNKDSDVQAMSDTICDYIDRRTVPRLRSKPIDDIPAMLARNA